MNEATKELQCMACMQKMADGSLEYVIDSTHPHLSAIPKIYRR